MPDLFLRSDAALDRKIGDCNDPEEIRRITKEHFQALGVIGQERGEGYGARVIRQPESEMPPEAPKNSASYGCERILYLGNTRIILTGPSESNLDAQEAAIRGQR